MASAMANSGAQQFGMVVGFAALLFSYSAHHRRYTCSDLQEYVAVPYRLKQYKIFYNEDGDVVGIVTWAWLSEYSINNITQDPRYSLHPSEWNEGRRLFIMDLVAPFGHFDHIARNLMIEQFKGVERCSWVRRGKDGCIRKCSDLWRSTLARRLTKGRPE